MYNFVHFEILIFVHFKFIIYNLYPNAYYNYIKDRKSEYRKEKVKVQEAIKSVYYNNGRIIGHRWMVIFLARKIYL